MRRGDLAIGAIIGLFVVGAAGIFFFKSGSNKSDLVALEKFDSARKSGQKPAAPVVEKPRASSPRNTVSIPPTAPPERTPVTHNDAPPVRAADSSPPPRVIESRPASPDSHAPLPNSGAADTKPPVETVVKPQPPSPDTRPPQPTPPAAAQTHVPESPLSAGPVPAAPLKLPLTHTVESGETLSEISQRYYNSTGASAIKLILKANPELKDPNHVTPGMKLLIPDRANPSAPPPAHPADAAPPKPKPRDVAPAGTIPATYRVQPKDTLISIAHRFYGDNRRWKDIYELNRTVIGADPEVLKLGAVLKLPPARSAASQPKH